MLNEEEKVHEVLDSVHNRHNNGTALSIPNFLPPKVYYPFIFLHDNNEDVSISNLSIRWLELGNNYANTQHGIFELTGLAQIKPNVLYTSFYHADEGAPSRIGYG